MTPEQFAKLLELIALGKVPDDRLSKDRVFHRGWNEGIEFVEQQIKKVLGQ